MREIKFEILLKATETPANGYSEGDTVKLVNDIFCKENGVAFWQIDHKAWDIVYKRQFTGLKDKNGKEVYEGDVFQNDSFTYVVEYQSGAFYLRHLLDSGNGGNWGLLSDLINHKAMYKDVYDCTELIGNIHEAKELPKDTKNQR